MISQMSVSAAALTHSLLDMDILAVLENFTLTNANAVHAHM